MLALYLHQLPLYHHENQTRRILYSTELVAAEASTGFSLARLKL